MLLSVNNISKEFETGPILSGVSFNVERRQKTALVGSNGSGKTTLLRIITGESEPDTGIVTYEKDSSFGYLSQEGTFSGGGTIFEEMLLCRSELVKMEEDLRSLEAQMEGADDVSAICERYEKLRTEFDLKGGYTFRSEIVGVLKGLGFSEDDFDRKASTLSGGQKTRAALGAILVKKPDLIILDEPTNHLDMNSVIWLEGYLSSYEGAVLIVSHDRYFLDKIADTVLELENTHVNSYKGNYSDYAAKKKMLFEAQMKAYINQQQEIKHQEEVIEKLKSFNREKSIKRAESREKALEKIEVLDRPEVISNEINLRFKPSKVPGNDVLTVENLSKSFDGRTLFKDMNVEIKRGEHVCIIGDNGTGKTTFLKILNGLETSDTGSFKWGTNVETAYYDQEHLVLNPENTIYDEISDEHPDMTITQIRTVLAAFLFTDDSVYKEIKLLSGGEKGRVSLAKLMLSDANFLILDEPTNHLDITTKEILEQALSEFEGTIICVSHDRYFVNKISTRIIELHEGYFDNYIGNYDYYLEKRDDVRKASDAHRDSSVSSSSASVSENAGTASTDSAADWKAQKALQAEARKKANDLKKCEDRITEIENELSEIETKMAEPDVATSPSKLNELVKKQTELNNELEELMEKWEALS
ncbi:MAG: ABC-F family ATP-binding cassette domain-containing protein [Lachnospiraceae bacterium]|nr:ABC-F family ATP-binding cassette domain-containing protein [Lachnospiraceae bacterium]